MTPLFFESQKVVTLLLFPPSPTPLLISDKSLNAEMAPSYFEVSYWPIQICYMPLQTVHTSQSLFFRKIVEIEHFVLRAAILDECQNYLGGGGRFGRKREK